MKKNRDKQALAHAATGERWQWSVHLGTSVEAARLQSGVVVEAGQDQALTLSEAHAMLHRLEAPVRQVRDEGVEEAPGGPWGRGM